jgi:hypothetical protein
VVLLVLVVLLPVVVQPAKPIRTALAKPIATTARRSGHSETFGSMERILAQNVAGSSTVGPQTLRNLANLRLPSFGDTHSVYTSIQHRIYGKPLMALHIRDHRAAKLARRLADRGGISMTEAVIAALEAALARRERPLPERLAEIAADARRLADPRRQRAAAKRDVDTLWGHS